MVVAYFNSIDCFTRTRITTIVALPPSCKYFQQDILLVYHCKHRLRKHHFAAYAIRGAFSHFMSFFVVSLSPGNLSKLYSP